MPSPVHLDRSLISDAAFSPIADKIERGERLSTEDGVALFGSPDMLGLGHMADAVNSAKHGNRVTFAANQHTNAATQREATPQAIVPGCDARS